MVLGIAALLTTGATILAATAIQHDPLVQNDVVQHYAYRALEAGSNAYLNNVNTNPNLINCNSNSPSGGECDPTEYDSWKQVDGTSGSGIVPEWYLWENPQFCFNTNCTVNSGTGTLLYVRITIYGAAGFPGHIVYQDSTQVLTPENGFLSRVWWSNYEATDPSLTGNPATACTYDYANAYNGPSLTSGACSAVYFASGDQLNGPIFSNDSIYVYNDPTLGPVDTADPTCQFVDYSAGCKTSGSGGIVTPSASGQAANLYKQPAEPLPTTDSSLEAFAALKGCVYYGPTTITFDTADQMTVWSQDTPISLKCLPSHNATTGTLVNVPNGVNGNGVIYVASVPAASCQSGTGGADAGANPFDNYQTSSNSNGSLAQWGYDGTYYDYAGHSSSTVPDCEGDAFVSDNPTAGGVSGQLTIAADNDIVITGNVEYTDCGSTFASTVTNPCSYNATGNNDALGLIANNYVEVNHPVVPNCTTSGSHKVCTGVTSSSTLEPQCTTQLGTPAAALCDPINGRPPNGTLTIDAAILALNHSFLVNNEGLMSSGGSSYGVGSQEGTLTVYGSIDQDWRGAVGITGGTSGYTKDYDWDSRLQYVTPPYYLAPGTPAWGLASSATDLTPSVPTCSGCSAP